MADRVRAIIIENGKLLAIKREKPNDTYWIFPGGAVEDGEDDKAALARECKEELGLDVEIGNLFGKTLFYWKGQEEENRFYFCKIIGGKLGSGSGPEYESDTYYEGSHVIEWLDLKGLNDIDLRPREIKSKIMIV